MYNQLDNVIQSNTITRGKFKKESSRSVIVSYFWRAYLLFPNLGCISIIFFYDQFVAMRIAYKRMRANRVLFVISFLFGLTIGSARKSWRTRRPGETG